MYRLTFALITAICVEFSTCDGDLFVVSERENAAFQVGSTSIAVNSIHCARSCKQLADCDAVRYDHVSRTCIHLGTSYLNGMYSPTTSSSWITLWRRKYECDEGWTLFESSCYFIPEEKENWNTSSDNCGIYNSHLVTITTAGEHEAVSKLHEKSIRSNSELWTGGRYVFTSGGTWAWMWVSGESWSFNKWGEEQPDEIESIDDKQVCLLITENVWDDHECDKKRHSMCEKAAVLVGA